MNLNDLLQKHDIAPADTLVLRHRPGEPNLRKKLPWLAATKPEVYNAYQQSQWPKLEKAFTQAKYIVSFIGTEAGLALFAGLYTIEGSRPIDSAGWWSIKANRELCELYGMARFGDDRPNALWFDLTLDRRFYDAWRGRLVIQWPGLERSWWRWANRNTFEINAIRETLAFEEPMPPWEELVLTWPDLSLLPSKWEASLREWRGIYFIFDVSDRLGYVGAAYGTDNILGRWRTYSISGHGGNRNLRGRDPKNFRFSILQRVLAGYAFR